MAFKIPNGKIIAFDTETTGLFPFKGDRPYCFSFANEIGETSVISFKVEPETRIVEYTKKEHATLKKFFENKEITKIAHNAQFDVKMCKAAGLEVKGPIKCTMNLIRITRSNEPMALKEFCVKNLGIPNDDEKELREATRKAKREGKAKGYAVYTGKGAEGSTLAPDYWLAPQILVERYAIIDAARCMAVYLSLMPDIKKENLESMWEQEAKIWKILRLSEKRGIRIFPEKVHATIKDLKKKLQTYLKQLPPKLNPNSPLQLRSLFYDKLKESQLYSTKAGFPSTDVDSLKAFKHPLAKTILNIRACTKTIEFMDQYLFFMQEHKDGLQYIHPTFSQARTVTGRESCADPNLQQVASGRNDKGIEVLVEARSVFGPRPGYQMRSYDWKNIEVFIPAFASGESKLIDVLKEGGDVHENTSKSLSTVVGINVSRDAAKRIFFGLLYGIGPKKLSKTLGIEENIGSSICHSFQREYGTLAQWMEELKYEAQNKGFIRTRYGRIIHLSNEETYKAPNYYVQGTAGGILRSAKIKIYQTLKEKKWDVKTFFSIHDEFLLEVKTQFLEMFDANIVTCMQDNPELNMPIPIPVSISAIGENWADKKKIKTL